jgi:hypothetical protein
MEPRQAIEAYRSINNLPPGVGTIAYGEVDGKAYMGVNSSLPGYTEADRAAANAMRDTLIAKYPEVMATENAGQKPNDSLYHAEATALLRAASEAQWNLRGRDIEVTVDRPLCSSCVDVLPFLTRELGIPTVTFRDPRGIALRIRNGSRE